MEGDKERAGLLGRQAVTGPLGRQAVTGLVTTGILGQWAVTGPVGRQAVTAPGVTVPGVATVPGVTAAAGSRALPLGPVVGPPRPVAQDGYRYLDAVKGGQVVLGQVGPGWALRKAARESSTGERQAGRLSTVISRQKPSGSSAARTAAVALS